MAAPHPPGPHHHDPAERGLVISLIAMAQLIVRNLDEDLVQRLKRRAAAHGRSMEEERRQLLRQALRSEGLAEALLAIPDVGDDADFERLPDHRARSTCDDRRLPARHERGVRVAQGGTYPPRRGRLVGAAP